MAGPQDRAGSKAHGRIAGLGWFEGAWPDRRIGLVRRHMKRAAACATILQTSVAAAAALFKFCVLLLFLFSQEERGSCCGSKYEGRNYGRDPAAADGDGAGTSFRTVPDTCAQALIFVTSLSVPPIIISNNHKFFLPSAVILTAARNS